MFICIRICVHTARLPWSSLALHWAVTVVCKCHERACRMCIQWCSQVERSAFDRRAELKAYSQMQETTQTAYHKATHYTSEDNTGSLWQWAEYKNIALLMSQWSPCLQHARDAACNRYIVPLLVSLSHPCQTPLLYKVTPQTLAISKWVGNTVIRHIPPAHTEWGRTCRIFVSKSTATDSIVTCKSFRPCVRLWN